MASFLSVLKAIGKGALFAGQMLLGVQTTVQQSGGAGSGVDKFLSKVLDGIGKAEQVAGVVEGMLGQKLPGEGKLDLAYRFAGDAINIAELVSGREIADNDKYSRGITAIQAGQKQIQSGIADVLDSLKHK